MTNRWTRCWTEYFNPRSREGSDVSRREHLVWTSYFNPRSREGSDACARFSRRVAIDFNPRSREGSDLIVCKIRRVTCHFNPRSREGSDQQPHPYAAEAWAFQSTLPRRERRYGVTAYLSPCTNFNPRSREGSDFKACGFEIIAGDFNPRSREGSDTGTEGVPLAKLISIHAPVKGATADEPRHVKRYAFQSTPP